MNCWPMLTTKEGLSRGGASVMSGRVDQLICDGKINVQRMLQEPTDPGTVPSLHLQSADFVLHQDGQDPSVSMSTDSQALLLRFHALPINRFRLHSLLLAHIRVPCDLHPRMRVRFKETHHSLLDVLRLIG